MGRRVANPRPPAPPTPPPSHQPTNRPTNTTHTLINNTRISFYNSGRSTPGFTTIRSTSYPRHNETAKYPPDYGLLSCSRTRWNPGRNHVVNDYLYLTHNQMCISIPANEHYSQTDLSLKLRANPYSSRLPYVPIMINKHTYDQAMSEKCSCQHPRMKVTENLNTCNTVPIYTCFLSVEFYTGIHERKINNVCNFVFILRVCPFLERCWVNFRRENRRIQPGGSLACWNQSDAFSRLTNLVWLLTKPRASCLRHLSDDMTSRSFFPHFYRNLIFGHDLNNFALPRNYVNLYKTTRTTVASDHRPLLPGDGDNPHAAARTQQVGQCMAHKNGSVYSKQPP